MDTIYNVYRNGAKLEDPCYSKINPGLVWFGIDGLQYFSCSIDGMLVIGRHVHDATKHVARIKDTLIEVNEAAFLDRHDKPRLPTMLGVLMNWTNIPPEKVVLAVTNDNKGYAHITTLNGVFGG